MARILPDTTEEYLATLDERVRQLERHHHVPDPSLVIPPAGMKDWATVLVAAADSHQVGKDNADIVCTGSADETKLDEAVALLPLVGGKIVLLEGTYNLTGSWIASNGGSIHIQGMGSGTRIRSSGSGEAVGVVGDGSGVSHLWVQDCDDGIAIFATEGFCYACRVTPVADGNPDGSIDGVGIVGSGSRVMIFNCWVEGAAEYGISHDSSEGVVSQCIVRESGSEFNASIRLTGSSSMVSDCFVYDSNGVGIHHTGGNPRVNNCFVESPTGVGFHITGSLGHVSNCIVEEGNSKGFHVTGSETAIVGNMVKSCEDVGYHVTGSSCRIVGNGLDAVDCTIGVWSTGSNTTISHNYISNPDEEGILNTGSYVTIASNSLQFVGEIGISNQGSDCNITDNIINNIGHHGIRISAHDCVVMGNKIRDIGTVTSDTYDGIFVDDDSDRNNIQGNMVRDISPGHRYGINISAASCDDNLVINNDLLNAGISGSFNDAGTGTVTASMNRL